MKYQITSAKTVKSFDMSKALEELSAVKDRLGEAAEQVVSVEGQMSEVVQVMEDCNTALESIKAFGVTAQNMTLLNGADHNLDSALGLEKLNIAGLESLSESTKKALAKNYEAGLENVIVDAWKKFCKWLKEFWAKIVQWFKELFDDDAKMLRIIKEADFTKLDEEAKAPKTLHSAADLKDLLKLLGNLDKNFDIKKKNINDTSVDPLLKKFGINVVDVKGQNKLTGGKLPAPAGGETLADCGWDTGSAEEIRAGFESLVKSGKKAAYAKQMADALTQLKTKANENEKDKAKQKAVQDQTAQIAAQTATFGVFEKLLKAVGSDLLKVATIAPKKGDKADTGAREQLHIIL